MLFTTGRAKLSTLADTPVTTAAWMTASPRPIAKPTRFELAPGIWIVSEPQWWPVSVLDTAAVLPYDDHVEPVRRRMPHPDWHLRAACAGTADYDVVFFGADDEANVPGRPPGQFQRKARAICAQCPVARECLTHALSQPESFGVWAGTTGRQRVKMQARLRAGHSFEEVAGAWLTR